MKIITSKLFTLNKCYLIFSSVSNDCKMLNYKSCFTVEHLDVFKAPS